MPSLHALDTSSIELPGEIQAMLDRGQAPGAPTAEPGLDPQLVLQNLAHYLVSKRKEAIDGRLASGIEQIWQACEDAYNGIDDANRNTATTKQRWQKPTSLDGPLTSGDRHRGEAHPRSTVFLPITARYVDMATAKITEILLAPDERSYSIRPTPVPEVLDAKDDERQLVTPEGMPLEREAQPGEPGGGLPTADQPLQPPSTVPLLVRDVAAETEQRAKQIALKEEEKIHDWLIEAGFSTEMAKVIFDSARLGVGILKGPFPSTRKATLAEADPHGQGMTVMIQEELVPALEWLSPWDMFPDPSCGDSIHNGGYLFQRARLSGRQLDALKAEPQYLADQIEQVLDEGPNKLFLKEQEMPIENPLDERYDVWHFEGFIERKDLLAIQPAIADALEGERRYVPVHCTLVNDSVIRVVLHTLESGSFLYHAIPWRPRQDFWAGSGIAEQLDAAQRLVNGTARSLSNNAGNAAGVQIVLDRLAVTPANNEWEITPDKLWLKNNESSTDDVKKAFEVYAFPSLIDKYVSLMQFWLQIAEEITSIPLSTQGLTGRSTPDTLGGMQLQDSNVNQLLRQQARVFDYYAMKPLLERMHEWYLLDPRIPRNEKGDVKIFAQGSMAIVERHIQQQTIGSMAAITKDPSYKIDPKKWAKQFIRANRLDPEDFQYTDQEAQRIDRMPPPKAPQVQAAEIRAQVDLQRAQLDRDRDTVYVQAETQRTEIERQTRLQELEAKTRLELLKYANQRQLSIEQVKAELAQTAMKLNAQRQMAAEDRAGEVLTPPNEPPGRAPAGQSWEK